ncbi:hypothetical protein HN803_07210 [candidate division WWE3 bacterium]|jgi:hypothetical protein|nr:hypothetical protein [candidate division WWE3 bacterium]
MSEIEEIKARIEGIERQVGVLPKPWAKKSEPALSKPVLKKPAIKKK